MKREPNEGWLHYRLRRKQDKERKKKHQHGKVVWNSYDDGTYRKDRDVTI